MDLSRPALPLPLKGTVPGERWCPTVWFRPVVKETRGPFIGCVAISESRRDLLFL